MFQVETVDIPVLSKQFKDGQIHLPVIVKPQMACGVQDAHKMVNCFSLSLSIPGFTMFNNMAIFRDIFHFL